MVGINRGRRLLGVIIDYVRILSRLTIQGTKFLSVVHSSFWLSNPTWTIFEDLKGRIDCGLKMSLGVVGLETDFSS